MKLFEVTNGYVGKSYLKVFVLAQDSNDAACIAKDRFRVYFFKKHMSHPEEPEKFWTQLNVECLCRDVSQIWSSEARDY